MRIEKNTILYKFLIILITFALVTVSLIYLSTYKIIKEIENEHIRVVIQRHSFEIKKIFEKVITELSLFQILRNPYVLEIKKIDVSKDIKSYWSKSDVEGIIVEEVESNKPKIVFSHLETIDVRDIKLDMFQSDSSFIEIKGNKMFYLVTHFPAWHWTTITLIKKEGISPAHSTINYISLALLVGVVLTIFIVAYFIHQTVISPIKGISNAVKQKLDISPIGIQEIDLLVQTINDALNDLIIKNRHLKMLHNALLDIHKLHSIDDIFSISVSIGRNIFGGQLTIILMYDRKDYSFKRYVDKTPSINDKDIEDLLVIIQGIFPMFKEVLFIHDEKEIENLIRPSSNIEIKNIAIYPIKLDYKDKDILFININRESNYDEYLKSLMGIFTMDISSAIDRARYIEELIRFQDIIDTSFDMIIITDENAVVLYVNKSFEKLTGYTSDEIVGKKISILKSGQHDKKFYDDLWATLNSKKVWKGEFINKKKNGEIFYDSSVIFPIYFGNKLNYVSIKRDITQEKNLYQNLIRAQKMEAIGNLASGLAHDFNNILTSIMGYSEIMLNLISEHDRYYKYIKTINDSAKKAAQLTKNILSFTRKDRLETKPVDVNSIIKEVLDIISHGISKQIQIVTHLSDDIPLTMADPSQINQVILNLSVNARDAMPNGGMLTISTSLVQAKDVPNIQSNNKDNQYIKISVSDTGEGIDSSIEAKIFDPFFTTKEKGKGTGLGLYIVYSIVTNHDGLIDFVSRPNEGTTFNIYLPVRKPIYSIDEKQTTYQRGVGNVLIIDDEPEVRNICRDMLESLGYSVMTAKDGVDGINIYKEYKDNIDVIILDMIMPKMKGDEVFFALKEINPKVKVIICSGFTHEQSASVDSLLKAGALGFIQKPFTISTLSSYISKATTNDS